MSESTVTRMICPVCGYKYRDKDPLHCIQCEGRFSVRTPANKMLVSEKVRELTIMWENRASGYLPLNLIEERASELMSRPTDLSELLEDLIDELEGRKERPKEEDVWWPNSIPAFGIPVHRSPNVVPQRQGRQPISIFGSPDPRDFFDDDDDDSDVPFTKRSYCLSIGQDDRGLYIAQSLDFPGCIGEGRTIHDAIWEAQDMIRETIIHFKQLNIKLPKPIKSENSE